MADNTTFQSSTLATPPSGLGVALKKATFSGDADQSIQLIEIVSLTGSEGSWTVNEISDASGLIVQDGGGSLTVDNAGTFAVQVDAALPAGDNNIGNVDIASSVALDVSAATVTVDLGANNDVTIDNSSIVHAEDAVHNTGDAGIMPLAVRNDTLAALAGTDGDYAPLQVNATGALYIQEGSALDVSAATVTVDNAGTFAVQVDAALPAGDNNIGNVDIASSVALDVSAATVTVDLGANNDVTIDNSSIVHTEDTQHSTGHDGIMALGVRNDGGTALAGTDGDYIPLTTDSSGNLYVNVAAGSSSGTEYTEDDVGAGNPAGPTLTMIRQDTPAGLVSGDGDVVAARATDYGALFCQILDSSGNFINTFGGSGGTAMNDDSAFTPGTDQVTPVGYFADETTPDSVDEGDIGAARMTLTRKAYAVLSDATSENNAGVDASGHLQVDIAADSVGIGGGTQYTLGTDTYAEATTVSTVAGAVRNDTLATLVDTDNELAPLQVNASGALYIQEGSALDVSAATVTVDLGANNDVTIDNSSIVHAEDAVHNSGDAGIMPLAVRNDVLAALATTDGDYAPLQVNASGALFIQEGAAMDVSAATVTVDNAGTFAVQVDAALPAGDNNIGNVDIASSVALDVSAATVTVDLGANNDVTIDNSSIVHAEDAVHGTGDAGIMPLAVRNDTLAALAGTDGDYAPLQVDATGALYIQEGSALDVSAATVTVDLGTNNDVQGDVAHDTADSGNPMKVGHKAIAHSSNPTAVAADDRTDWYANRHGIPFMIGGHPNVLTTQLNVTDTDGAQTDTALVTVGAGNKIVVTWISVTADNANTGDVQCRIGFGATTTPANDAADVIVSHPGIAAGSGLVIGDGSGMLGVGADGEDLRLTCEDPAGGALDVVVGYYTIES